MTELEKKEIRIKQLEKIVYHIIMSKQSILRIDQNKHNREAEKLIKSYQEQYGKYNH